MATDCSFFDVNWFGPDAYGKLEFKKPSYVDLYVNSKHPSYASVEIWLEVKEYTESGKYTGRLWTKSVLFFDNWGEYWEFSWDLDAEVKNIRYTLCLFWSNHSFWYWTIRF